jgi:hypothetical protein
VLHRRVASDLSILRVEVGAKLHSLGFGIAVNFGFVPRRSEAKRLACRTASNSSTGGLLALFFERRTQLRHVWTGVRRRQHLQCRQLRLSPQRGAIGSIQPLAEPMNGRRVPALNRVSRLDS